MQQQRQQAPRQTAEPRFSVGDHIRVNHFGHPWVGLPGIVCRIQREDRWGMVSPYRVLLTHPDGRTGEYSLRGYQMESRPQFEQLDLFSQLPTDCEAQP